MIFLNQTKSLTFIYLLLNIGILQDLIDRRGVLYKEKGIIFFYIKKNYYYFTYLKIPVEINNHLNP